MSDVERKGDLHGFVDYSYCFPAIPAEWVISGFIFLIAAIIAYFPQTLELLQQKTSYGLSAISVYGQTVMQFFSIMNVIHLMGYDFVGILQYPLSYTYKEYITFLIMLFQWVEYAPVVFLSMMYHDREKRSTADPVAFKRSWILAMAMVSGFLVSDIIMLIIWIALGFANGFQSKSIISVGMSYGYFALAIDVFQFIPQLIETCTIKDNGALSLYQVGIQAVTDLGQAIYMIVGQGADVSTFINGLFDSSSEWFLIILCLFYKWRNRRNAHQAALQQSVQDHVYASVGVTPLNSDLLSSDIAVRV